MIVTGDMPAVSQMSHTSTSAGKYGCRICEVKGRHPDNMSSGMYFCDNQASLRPKVDYLKGNAVSKNIK